MIFKSIMNIAYPQFVGLISVISFILKGITFHMLKDSAGFELEQYLKL